MTLTTQRGEAMRVRRLGWAGVELEADGQTLLIDPVSHAGTLALVLPPSEFVEPAPGRARAVLLTHLHADHADPDLIGQALSPDGRVLRPPAFDGSADENAWTRDAEAGLAAGGLDVRTVSAWDTRQVGPFTVTAVPAVDGLGDPQVNWSVSAAGTHVFHGGDTIFHGYWWLIAGRIGPVDLALLPINGASVDFPHLRPPSDVPAVMTPEQAVTAALVLEARSVVPMHYGISGSPYYREVPDPLVRFRQAAAAAGVAVHLPRVGEPTEVRSVQ